MDEENIIMIWISDKGFIFIICAEEFLKIINIQTFELKWAKSCRQFTKEDI